MVYEAVAETFWTRHVTSQTTARFGRDGKSSGGRWWIMHHRLDGPLHRRCVPLRSDWIASSRRPDYPDSIMSKAEVQLVLTHDKFFKQRLLPGTQGLVTWASGSTGQGAFCISSGAR